MAEQMQYTAEKALKDNGDKVPAELKTSVQSKIDAVKTAKAGTDISAIKKATEELSGELSKIGEAISKANAEQASQAGAQTPPTGDQGGNAGTEGPVRDAEFKEGAGPTEEKK